TRLEAVGVQIAIDDFGSGFSSLSHLKRFPIDEIKVDRPFIAGMIGDSGDRAIVRTAIDLAHHFGLRVLAEGVEREDTRQALIAAIAMLAQLEGPAWVTPLLKFFFTISYVVLAFLVGAFADSMPKGRVMFVTNTVKVVGCVLILFNEFLRIGNMHAYWLVLLA